jgi:hypothetical protein
MKWYLSTAVLAVCGFAALCRCFAAPPPTPPVQISVPLWVEPPLDLTKQELRVTLNGKPAPVLRVLGPSSDVMILVVLDLTGDIGLVDVAKHALIEQISNLPKNAWVGLLRAQDGLSVIADPTPDREKINEAIQNLTTTGKAGLLDTVTLAATLADRILRKSNVRVAILYVTDSDIENYRADYTNPVINSSDPHDLSRRFPEALIQEKISALQMQIASYEAPLFITHLRNLSSRMNQAYQNGLKMLSEFTAGYAWFCRSDAEIPDVIQREFAYIRSSWLVTAALPKHVRKDVQVRLQLPEHKEARIAYRARLHVKAK